MSAKPPLDTLGAVSAPAVTAAEAPFLPFHRPSIGEAEIAAVVDTLRSGWLTMGPKTRSFEERFASRVEAPLAVAVSSATAGLHLGLDALGIGPGDEVLVPTLTFASTAATVIHVGARPVLVDVEPDTLNLDVADAERKWTPRTRAIGPVHFAGHPCDLDPILALAAARGAAVMEDAAHALPAAYRGRSIGSVSDLTVFSFYATKNLATGEGGMVTGRDEALIERVRGRRLHGMTRDAWKRYAKDGTWRYDVAYPGFKYNMTDMNAALGLVQLERLAAMQAARLHIVERYRAAFADVADLVEVPTCRSDVDHAWHLFVARVRHEALTIDRDAVIQALTAAGIGTSVHFIPLHEHSYYRDQLGVRAETLPVADREWERIISLPLYPGLSDADVDRVADTLRDILRRHRR
ncbi:MAG: DegT/DnrJ/EryC1/StrS aminotransferase family protein [Deltaproteobacteria bacterium]|nr:DegT/DnrJ/EryC1/StrS aminotransferase family protein [Deltaproteobacteria bacterium]